MSGAWKLPDLGSWSWGTLNTNPTPITTSWILPPYPYPYSPGCSTPEHGCSWAGQGGDSPGWSILSDTYSKRSSSQTLRDPNNDQRGAWNLSRARTNNVMPCLIWTESFLLRHLQAINQIKLYEDEPLYKQVLRRHSHGSHFGPRQQLCSLLTARKLEKSK